MVRSAPRSEEPWIPAFAGMTELDLVSSSGFSSSPRRKPGSRLTKPNCHLRREPQLCQRGNVPVAPLSRRCARISDVTDRSGQNGAKGEQGKKG